MRTILQSLLIGILTLAALAVIPIAAVYVAEGVELMRGVLWVIVDGD